VRVLIEAPPHGIASVEADPVTCDRDQDIPVCLNGAWSFAGGQFARHHDALTTGIVLKACRQEFCFGPVSFAKDSFVNHGLHFLDLPPALSRAGK
jgi:hypothetical protein